MRKSREKIFLRLYIDLLQNPMVPFVFNLLELSSCHMLIPEKLFPSYLSKSLSLIQSTTPISLSSTMTPFHFCLS